MTSSCLSQFRSWKIPILVGVWKGKLGISWSFNGVLFSGASYRNFMDISIPACSSIHLKFSHHISALWSEVHLVSYSYIWGRFSRSIILYYNENYLCFNFINISVWNGNISHVLLSNIEEIVPFPQYLVVNSCNLDGIEYMCAQLIIYEWKKCN